MLTRAEEGLPENIYVPLGPGTRLRDRYVIQQQLGQGGFGRTYRAEDSGRFNAIIVLKELTPSVQGTYALKKAEELFQREAETLHRLDHPQIPRFWEIFQAEKRLFLVEDFADGPTYQQLVETRQQQGQSFDEAEVTQLFRDLLPVLSYLHGQGVIHRDISPDNIIRRNKDGLPILIDLGGVKQVAIEVATEMAHEHSNLQATTGGTRLGKIGYAPDEQMRLGLVAPHSDLYALAVTALVLLTGKPPQQLQDPHSLAWLWQRDLTLAANFSEILQKMLAARPMDRYQSAAEIVQALNTQLEPPPTQIMPLVPPTVSPGVPPTVAATLPVGYPFVSDSSAPGSASFPTPQPVASQPLASLSRDEETRKKNIVMWSIAGGLSVLLIGVIAAFGLLSDTSTVDPVVSPEASSLPRSSSSSSPASTTEPKTRDFQSVKISGLETYTHPSNVFSLLVPSGWKVEDVSSPGELLINWSDSTENARIIADIFDDTSNPDQAALTKLLQNFLRKTYSAKESFFLEDPKPQADGSVLLIWGYTATATGNIKVKLLGNSFIEREGSRVAILTFILPSEQFEELKEYLNRMSNSYKVDTQPSIPGG
ncbi:MAG: protein kinase [Acaryochloridaceae cyanobacterium SU_2_1]|nr:protein kinase [Acaryochloridaceae cyanobacterium SU_2_1]